MDLYIKHTSIELAISSAFILIAYIELTTKKNNQYALLTASIVTRLRDFYNKFFSCLYKFV